MVRLLACDVGELKEVVEHAVEQGHLGGEGAAHMLQIPARYRPALRLELLRHRRGADARLGEVRSHDQVHRNRRGQLW